MFRVRATIHLATLAFCAGLALSGCGSKDNVGGDAAPVQFSDITQQAGITFTHHTGARGLKWIPEVMGSGVAFIDADGDGYQDIFFVNGRDWTDAEVENYKNGNGRNHLLKHGFAVPPAPPRQRATCVLYHNNGDGTFTDVTAGSGLDVELYGMGVCVGDYDNDGNSDIYVTAYPRNYLFRNLGTGQGHKVRFEEVAQSAGVRDSGWSIAATWLDYDKDGKLDLFVSHYLGWKPALDFWLTTDKVKSYAGPEHYPAMPSALYHNEGGGRFTDVSQRAGITQKQEGRDKVKILGKAMSVTVSDTNNDGWPDIVVANDLTPNHLFKNNGNGTFQEIGVVSGIAYGAVGTPRSGMGVDSADIDQTNLESVAITNFSSEMAGLYQNQGNGTFADMAAATGVAEASAPYTGFGCLFSDVDNDGWPDLILANGNVYNRFEATSRSTALHQPLQLFHNQGRQLKTDAQKTNTSAKNTRLTRGLFEDVTLESGKGFQKRLVGRGLASADIDLDGDIDLIATANAEAPLLLRNDGGNRNHAIRVVLRGTKSNRDAIGALVWGEIGNQRLRRRVRSSSSYLSQSELPVTLGLGQSPEADVVVRWPSDKLSRFKRVAANQIIIIDETKGIIKQQPFRTPPGH